MVSIALKCILLVSITPLWSLKEANWTKLPEDHPLLLADAAVVLIQKLLVNKTTTLVIVQRNAYPQLNNHSSDLMEHILLNIQPSISVQLYFGHSKDQPWEYHVFLVDGPEAFKQIRWSFPLTFFERNFRFLIILTSYLRPYLLILRQIFTYCYEYHVLNAHVVLKHPLHGVVVYSYKLYSPRMCRVVQPVLYFPLNAGIHDVTPLFPEKMVNLYGCPVKIVARENSPLLSFEGNLSNPKPIGFWNNLQGIDADLIKLISLHMNFTIILQPFPIDRPSSSFSVVSGCFGELLSGEADIGIGGFSASDLKRDILSATHSYHQSPVVFVVCGDEEYKSFARLARPFQGPVWIVLSSLLILGAAIIVLVRFQIPSVQRFVFGSGNNAPMTNFFAAFLGYPVTQEPRRNFARYLLLVWLLASLIIRNAYQGSMYDSIRSNRFKKVPSGFDELMRWEYNIFLPVHYDEMGLLPRNRTIIATDNAIERLLMLSGLKGKFGTVVLHDNYVKFIEKYDRNTNLQMINEQLYVHQTAMYFGKHSTFMGRVNHNLKQFDYAGIIGYVVRQNTMKNPEWVKVRRAMDAERPISYDRLSGSFKLYAAFVGVAFIAFIFELMTKCNRQLRTFFDRIN